RHSHPQSIHSFPTRRSSDLKNILFFILLTVSLQIKFAITAGARLIKTCNYSLQLRINSTKECFSVYFPKTQKSLDFSRIFMIRRSEEHTSELQSRFDIVCRL